MRQGQLETWDGEQAREGVPHVHIEKAKPREEEEESKEGRDEWEAAFSGKWTVVAARGSKHLVT